MPGKRIPVNTDLYCAECGSQGMKLTATKAESGKQRYKCPACGFRTTRALYNEPQILPKTRAADVKKHKRFLITSAVNDTPLVKGAHETFQHIAEDLDAGYFIIPCVYKNPDLRHQGIIDSMSWPNEILPHVCNTDVKLNKHLYIRGGTRINWTNINPVGMVAITAGAASGIYGHGQVQMEMIPTSKELLPKMIHTTGTISKPNYGGSGTAQKAASHHSISAVFIEIEGESFWYTQVHYDGKGAYLFDKYYTSTELTSDLHPLGLVYGDIHIGAITKRERKLLRDITSALQPEIQVFHDLHSQLAHSHHNANSKLYQLANPAQDIRKELELSIDFIDSQPGHCVIVESNHHDHLSQWFNRFRPERDPVNIALYYELGHMAEELEDGNLFRLYMEMNLSNTDVEFTTLNQLYEIAGVDVSQHGHRGLNGARSGTPKSFARTGHKTVTAHRHAPCIEKGGYGVGTSSMHHEYARGYSSWMITHCAIYPNGKRALHSAVKGKLSPIMRDLVK